MNTITRLPLPAAYLDPAFIRCLDEAVEEQELIDQFNRLYRRSFGTKHAPEADMRAFVEFVHRRIYSVLPDEAIVGLRLVKERV